MLTLAMDTATKVCSVALTDETRILAAYDISMGLTHSEGLLPQLEQLFQRTGIAKKTVQRLAVSIGPGSFTGLRIGLATAEALAYAWGCEIVGVKTMPALAYNVPVPGVYVVPVLDAQKGNYYSAIYTWEQGKVQERQQVSVLSGPELLAQLGALEKPVVLLGECSRLTTLTLPDKVQVAAEQLRWPKAASVALAALNPDCVMGRDLFQLAPYYIRRSEAEELWEKKQQAAGK